MKTIEIRNLSDEELAQKEKDMREEYFNLRFQFFTGQLENTARLTQIKRDIARIQTIANERSVLGIGRE